MRLPRMPGAGPAEHDAIPEETAAGCLWNDTARVRFALLRSKKRLSQRTNSGAFVCLPPNYLRRPSLAISAV